MGDMRRVGFGTLAFIILRFMAQSGFSQQSGPSTAVTPARITLDVLVTDKEGKLASELEPTDFMVLDNNEPRKILGFRRTDGVAGNKFDPPVELIIVLDAVNLSYQAITLQRLELEKFLRRNQGHLAQPTSLFLFGSQGLEVQPAPSKDGNALAAMLDKSTGTVRARDLSGGVYSLVEQFQDSFKAFNGIAENESRKPGRKLLIWIGPGWPLLTERFFIQSSESRQAYFNQLVTLTKRLRDARITVYNVAPIVGVTRTLYEDYLKPVTGFRKMEIGDLALEVQAIHTGGRVMDPDNDLARQIDRCLSDVGEYYTLTFAPTAAGQSGEYHEIKVQVVQPGLTARTNTGYYNQP
jgi:VWFA-related protein